MRCRHLLRVSRQDKVSTMTGEDRSRDSGNFWMIVLIVLALVATVIMLFSDSSAWLQIALLASLWAAIIGFLLVTRARKDREQAEALLAAREREHDAELEALRARNEAARAADGQPPAADTDVLRDIRAELAALRAQLEDLSGREFGYEPAALQAEARRIREIEARTQQAQPAGPSQPAQPAPQMSNSTEDTARITPVRDRDEKEAINALSRPTQPATSHISGAPSSDAVAGRVGSQPIPEGRNPLTDLIRERQEERERAEQEAARQRAEQEARERAEREARERAEREARERAEREARERAEREARERAEREAQERAEREARERAEQEARERAERKQAAQAVQAEPAEQEAPEETHRGRRRADEHREGALTVAEILARSKKNK